MSKTKMFVAIALLAGTIAGCIVRTGRPCRTDCWWDHGRRLCERRCN
jgi:hypothetical protein